jgi:hypothetical protein
MNATLLEGPNKVLGLNIYFIYNLVLSFIVNITETVIHTNLILCMEQLM